MNTPWRAVALLDRDHTLNDDPGYISHPDQVVLLPRAAEAIRLLNREGVCCLLFSNQSGIGRGLFTEEQLAIVQARLVELLAAEGARLDGLYHCPAHPEGNSPDRKPGRGMFDRALREHPITGLPVFGVGDRQSDVDFTRNCGGTAVLLQPDSAVSLTREGGIAQNLYQAAEWILTELHHRQLPQESASHRKLQQLDQLVVDLQSCRDQGECIVLANGCFDVIHGGHVSYLESAREQGDRLVLAVNSNSSVRDLKGPGRPFLREDERIEVLCALEAVDHLVLFHEPTVERVLRVIRPAVHAKGTDYTAENVPERAIAEEIGSRVFIAGAPKENSSRDIFQTIRERHRAGLL